MKNSILIVIFMSISSVSLGQVYEIGFSVGSSNYVGDIGRTNYIYPSKPAGALSFKYNYNPRIVLRAAYSYLPIEGNDLDADTDFRRDRGLQFTNTIHELAIGLEYNFYEYDLSSEDKTWTPYILLELATFNYKFIENETAPNQYTYDTKNGFSVPVGLGFKSKLIGPFAFSIESKVVYSFADDLDFTSPTVPDLHIGGTGNDWYMFTGFSLIYTFGRPACYTTGF